MHTHKVTVLFCECSQQILPLPTALLADEIVFPNAVRTRKVTKLVPAAVVKRGEAKKT